MAERADGPTHQLALIDGFVIDCLLSDNHTFDAEVTEFPVESGSTISDHIRNKPLVVTMECIVSNTPIDPVASQFRGGDAVPADDAYALLRAIRKDRRLVDVDTSLDHFENMALESLSIPRASGRGDELRFTATFKQVEIVKNKREVRVALPAAQAPRKSLVMTDVLGTREIYLNREERIWFDVDINAWRETAKWLAPSQFRPGNTNIVRPKDTKKPAPSINGHKNDGGYLLEKERPIEMTAKEWNDRTIDQDRDYVIKPLLKSRRKGKPGPTPERMIVLDPGEYLIQLPQPET